MATEEQIAEFLEDVREIVDVSDSADVALRLSRLSDAGFTATTTRDVPAWQAVVDSNDVIKGDGIVIDDSKTRLDIRNRVRIRLGYPRVGESGQVLFSFEDDCGTQSIDVCGGW